jgi:S1-C subfamily serine protease
LIGVLIRKATIDELTAPDSAFVKRPVRVAQDPVGYGFVIRGDGPVYVKTVDPMGPAAKAGLRVKP